MIMSGASLSNGSASADRGGESYTSNPTAERRGNGGRITATARNRLRATSQTEGGITAASLLLTTAVFGYSVGPVGVAVGAALGATWLLSGPLTTYAIGQVTFVVLTGRVDGINESIAVLSVVQGGLWGVLCASLAVDDWRLFGGATTLLVAGSVGAASLASGELGSVGTAVGVVAALAVLGYGVHRYELAALGLAGEIDE